MSQYVARLPQDIINIIMKYKEEFEIFEAFMRFFNEIFNNLIGFELKC